MKVLWFANTPSLGEEYLTKKEVGGGWIKSLEQVIQTKVELSVAFYHNQKIEPFKFGETDYYPIFSGLKKNSITSWYSRLSAQVEPNSQVDDFVSIVEKVNPDVIHILGTEQSFGLVQDRLGVKVPIVISIQGNLTVYVHKYFSAIPKMDVIRYSTLKDVLMAKDGFTLFRMFGKKAERERKILALSENIIGRTDWDRRITRILAPKSRYHHNDEILRDLFYENDWNQTLGNHLNVITTTGPVIYKGIETVLQASLLLDKLGVSYTWRVLGITEDNGIVKMMCRHQSISVSKNVIFMGLCEESQVVKNLQESHIYIMPSHIENSPNSLCEAMLLGMPCIATNAGGTSSLLKDGEDGILVQDGDPWAMAGAILELQKNWEKAIKMASFAKYRAIRRHDKQRIGEELMGTYRFLVSAS